MTRYVPSPIRRRSECQTVSRYKPGSLAGQLHAGYVHFFRKRLGRNPPAPPCDCLEGDEAFFVWCAIHAGGPAGPMSTPRECRTNCGDGDAKWMVQ